jgi:hypothetical protein
MATVNAGMTISLDGYVADRSGIPTACTPTWTT